jgi:hypothetical protein
VAEQSTADREVEGSNPACHHLAAIEETLTLTEKQKNIELLENVLKY